MQYATDIRNAKLDAIETIVGESPVLKVFDGAIPENCAAPDAGTVLATLALPVDWMEDAQGGSKSMAGEWRDTSADGTGTARYFRIYGGGVCKIQGSCGLDDVDMVLDSVQFTAGQGFSVVQFVIHDNNG